MILPLGTIMTWTRGAVVCNPSDHARSPLSVDPDRMGNSSRMANGRLRKYHIADKRTWSTSWSMLPAPSDMTADEKDGAAAMEDFYNNTRGEFLLTVTNKDAGLDYTVPVVFTEFSKEIAKRGAYDMWDVTVSIEEV